MMKKRYLFGFLLAMSALCTHAEQVTPGEAKQKAAEFLSRTAPANAPRRAKAAKATLLQVWPAATNTANKVKLKAPVINTGTDYYIFNTADSTAFVVVSGESTTRSILAYSTEGFFNMDDIAPGAQYLLDGYAEQIEMVKNGEAVAKADEPVLYADGEKLLETANWNQSYDFWWSQCPTYNGANCHAGCVATAMAIVMRYHQWPNQGVGSSSYDLGAGYSPQSPSVNFGNATYSWASLPLGNQIESAAQWTAANQTEVAKILYHCGVSVRMDYATEVSGSNGDVAAKALRRNFRYAISTHSISRSSYTATEWSAILKNEIDKNRPVMVCGSSNEGSLHEFVCDGYRPDGTFHFNMGWGGSANGWFSDGQITGEAYTLSGAIIGIEKTTENIDYSDLIFDASSFNLGVSMDDKKNVIKGAPFSITGINLRNEGNDMYMGDVSAALYSANGTFKGLVGTTESLYGMAAGSCYGIWSISCNVPTDMDMQPTDRIWMVTHTSDDGTWKKIYCIDEETSSVPVSGYPGVFFCQGHNGQDAYVYGNVTDDVKSQLAAQADVTRIDLTNATQSSAFDLTGVNPNAYVEGTTAAITGALTKSLTTVSLTDNKPYYADGTQSVSSVTYTRVFNADNAASTNSAPLWQTICLPFNVARVTYGNKTLNLSNHWLYKICTNGYERVRTGNIEANTPYLIAFACGTQYGDESVSGEVTFAGTGTLQTTDVTSGLYATNNYKMVGYYGPATTNAAYYALNAEGTKFVSGNTINPFHPYAIVPGEVDSAKGRLLAVFGNDVTAIEAVGAENGDGGAEIVSTKGGVNVTATKAGIVNVYSVNGALLGVFSVSEGTTFIRLPQGIFIVNGVKVIVSE